VRGQQPQHDGLHARSAVARAVVIGSGIGDAGTAGRVCAALNALTHTGDTGSDAIATAEGAYHLTRAQVIHTIDERRPALKQIVPTRG
jgi:hypothetical protein